MAEGADSPRRKIRSARRHSMSERETRQALNLAGEPGISDRRSSQTDPSVRDRPRNHKQNPPMILRPKPKQLIAKLKSKERDSLPLSVAPNPPADAATL